MKIVKQAQDEVLTSYSLSFAYENDPGAGFGFECDAKGKVSAALAPLGRANYEACLTGVVRGQKVVNQGIKQYKKTYRSAAIGKCDCGQKVELTSFTNTCQCGLDYNSFGQQLAPREQWGEETGETAADILSGYDSDY